MRSSEKENLVASERIETRWRRQSPRGKFSNKDNKEAEVEVEVEAEAEGSLR